jgi:hypothetical protein
MEPAKPAGRRDRAGPFRGKGGGDGRADGTAASGTPFLRPGGAITTTPERGDVADCALPLRTGPSVVILSLCREREREKIKDCVVTWRLGLRDGFDRLFYKRMRG